MACGIAGGDDRRSTGMRSSSSRWSAGEARSTWGCGCHRRPTASGSQATEPLRAIDVADAAVSRLRHRLHADRRRRCSRWPTGTGIVTENVFDNRLAFVGGAEPHGRGHSPRRVATPWCEARNLLSGAPVRAFDVRAGAALVLAGLVAEGETGSCTTPITSTAATRTSPGRSAASAPTSNESTDQLSSRAADRRGR